MIPESRIEFSHIPVWRAFPTIIEHLATLNEYRFSCSVTDVVQTKNSLSNSSLFDKGVMTVKIYQFFQERRNISLLRSV